MQYMLIVIRKSGAFIKSNAQNVNSFDFWTGEVAECFEGRCTEYGRPLPLWRLVEPLLSIFSIRYSMPNRDQTLVGRWPIIFHALRFYSKNYRAARKPQINFYNNRMFITMAKNDVITSRGYVFFSGKVRTRNCKKFTQLHFDQILSKLVNI